VSAPKRPFHFYHRDRQMRTDGNLGATTSYNPNSQGLWDNQPGYGLINQNSTAKRIDAVLGRFLLPRSTLWRPAPDLP
jgi:catalase